MSYETLKVLPGDVLTAHEYLARCKEIPAQPATALDTSPPSRTSNAASANGAASLLALIESVDKYFSITNRTHPQVEITLPEWQLIKSALQQRIEVSGEPVKQGRQRLGEIPAASFTDGESREAGEAAGLSLTSIRPPLPEPAIRGAVYGCTDAQCVCGRCGHLGFSPLSEVIARSEKIPSRKAALDRARGVRFAVDPWQGLGKTWSDK